MRGCYVFGPRRTRRSLESFRKVKPASCMMSASCAALFPPIPRMRLTSVRERPFSCLMSLMPARSKEWNNSGPIRPVVLSSTRVWTHSMTQ